VKRRRHQLWLEALIWCNASSLGKCRSKAASSEEADFHDPYSADQLRKDFTQDSR
jgi:hypothetical protein